MSRQGAKNSMSMKPMKAEHHRDTRSEQVATTTKQRLGRTKESQTDCGIKGLNLQEKDVHHTPETTKGGTREIPGKFKNK
jgi:hypothetical protein